MKLKIVIKVPMHCDKAKSKAMQIAAAVVGVSSVTVLKDNDGLEVTGEGVDSVCLAKALRKKFCIADIIKVEEVKPPPEKKEEPKPCKPSCAPPCKCKPPCPKPCKTSCEPPPCKNPPPCPKPCQPSCGPPPCNSPPPCPKPCEPSCAPPPCYYPPPCPPPYCGQCESYDAGPCSIM